MRIALKYCGACNPETDLPQIGESFARLAREQGWQVVKPDAGCGADVLVLLCGCPRACVDTPKLRQHAGHVVVLSGKQVEWQPMREDDIPAAIMEAVRGLAASRR